VKSKTDDTVPNAKLHDLRRVTRFARRWLKKNHPVIYAQLIEAIADDKRRYDLWQMKKFNDKISKLFKP